MNILYRQASGFYLNTQGSCHCPYKKQRGINKLYPTRQRYCIDLFNILCFLIDNSEFSDLPFFTSLFIDNL